jgi:hypothetical protein
MSVVGMVIVTYNAANVLPFLLTLVHFLVYNLSLGQRYKNGISDGF